MHGEFTTEGRPLAAQGRRSLRRTLGVSAAASALAAATLFAAGILRGTYPFGPTSRNTNDLGEQFIPMYAYARDVITGNADGGLVWTWQSGHGVPFLGDSLAYVGTTLSWLTLLFPRDRIDLALYAVFVAAVALGAGLMALLLQWLRPQGPAWLAVLGGVAYGASAWPVETAYMTVWLNGVVAFPLLCLVADWVSTSRTWRSWVFGPPLVALAWTSHFYTAYMATIGAAIFVVARLLSRSELPAAERLKGLVRCGLAFLLGIGLAAPLLVPVYRLIRGATPSPPVELIPVAWDIFLTRLLPGTAGVANTPAIGVGVLTLVLAATAVLNSRMPAAERLVWPVTLVLVVVSMRFQPTHLIWHAFDTPNGNPYRQSFVTAGLIVIVAWLSASRGVKPVLVAGGAVAAGGLWVWTRGLPDRTSLTTPILLTMAVVVVLGWTLVSLRRRGAGFAMLGAGLLLAATAAEATASHVAIDERRSTVISAREVWGPRHEAARKEILANDAWPTSRADPGWLATNNDPMLIGGQGSEYYTSTIQTPVSDLHAALGWGYSSYGRALVDPGLEVTDAIFGTSFRLGEPPEGSENRLGFVPVRRGPVAPIVSVRGPVPAHTSDTVWGAQERALGAMVYEIPDVTLTPGPGVRVTEDATGFRIRARPGHTVTMTARCTPGSAVLLGAPALVTKVTVPEREFLSLPTAARSPGRYTGMPMKSLGSVGPDGLITATLTTTVPSTGMPGQPLGCLDPTKLSAAVTALQAQAATDVVTGSRSIAFTVPAQGPGPAKHAVITTTLTPGWRCDGPVSTGSVESYEGFMGIPLNGEAGRVSCSFRPWGLGLGLLAGGGAVAAWLGLLALGLLVARRRRTTETVRLAA